jgi:hypothetical protein
VINIKELTLGQVDELRAMFAASPSVPQAHPYEVGANYFIRTVTHHQCGRLTAVFPQELVLEDASWIADDGRFTDALKTGNFNEVELFAAGRPVIIGRGSLVDCQRVDFDLPRSQR